MTKKDALIKIADKTLWGTAFGGAIGALPGVAMYDKKKKGESLAKILGGAGIGATVGGLVSKYNGDSSFPLNHTSLANRVLKGSVMMGAIGALPGVVEYWVNRKEEEKEKKKANKRAIKMILAGSTLGATLGGFNTGFHSIVK